jgi:hypothetical protein
MILFSTLARTSLKSRQALRLDRAVPQLTVASFKKYYKSNEKYRKELKDYPVFVPVYIHEGQNETEIEWFIEFFKLYNFQMFLSSFLFQ